MRASWGASLTYRTHVRYNECMVQVQLGYAADRQGAGVAYARLSTRTGERLVRAAFRAQRFTGLEDREVSYAAIAAIATLLREHKMDRITFLVPDQRLIDDREKHRDLPPPLVLPYVRLGCALNRLKECELRFGADPDLDQRACAEVALHTAA